MYNWEIPDSALRTWVRLRQTSDTLERCFKSSLSKVEASPAHADVLGALAASTREMTVGEITACTLRDQAGGSAQLTGLSAKGLIKKTRSKKDQRVVSVEITPKGREAWARAQRSGIQDIHRIIMSSLSKREMETLDMLLRKLRDGALRQLGQEAGPLPQSIVLPSEIHFDERSERTSLGGQHTGPRR